ncbi:DUF1353 domain-containing protein [Pseudomonas sp. AF03-9]|uniref:DUF1353 domain-containing protein n=1 Tax=Pseudomonas sp. AF03-9 TaxID=2849867 RepID=UPI001CFB7AFF|nr:DUF1353 domain-containing protein [Pseudomonas sp. AF03-9]
MSVLRYWYWVAFIALAALIQSCVSMPPPGIARLADNVFVVIYPLRYRVEQTAYVIEVPRGFITDLASIPRALWWWESPLDRSMAAAIVHDYLYWDQTCTKDEADAVLFIAMKENGVSKLTRNGVYAGVKTPFGDRAFENNTKARLGGESRYFTSTYTNILLDRPVTPDDTLQSIQRRATAEKGMVKLRYPQGGKLKETCKAALSFFKTTPL